MTLVELRDYQRDAVQAPFTFMSLGKRRMIISLPTGAGKTVVAGAIIDRLRNSPHEHFLFLVPRIRLVYQTKKSFLKDFFEAKDVGVIQGDTKEYGRQITIACTPTLRQPEVLQEYLASIGGSVDLVFVDEAQMFGYDTILTRSLLPDSLLIGLSATPYRADLQNLKIFFPDDICCVEEYWDLIKQGWLVDITSYDVKAEMPAVIDEDIDFYMRRVQGLSVTKTQHYRYAKIYKEWLVHGENKRTLGFCQSVKDCYTFRLFLKAMGHTCEVISSKTSDSDRDVFIDQFTAGEITFLLNYEVMTTGVDIPEIECLIMMRKTENLGLWSQCIGRGLRPCPWIDKKRVVILNCTEDGHTLMMFGRLFGITDPNIPSMRAVLKEKEEYEIRQEAAEYTVHILDREIKADAKESNLFIGGDWLCDPITKHWSKDWRLAGETYKLYAMRLATGCYQPLVILPDGKEHILSDSLLSKNDALRVCQKHMVAVERGAQKITELDPVEMAKPIRADQIDYLLKRRVPLRPMAGAINKPLGKEGKMQLLREMKQGDYQKINKHLRKYGAARSEVGGNIGYFGMDGVRVWGPRTE